MSDDPAQSAENAEQSPAADPQSIEGLFVAALGHASATEREAFLDEACGDDAERRRRIEALLRAYEDAGSFLEKPPAGASPAETVSLEFLAPSDDPGLLGMLGPYEVYEVLGRGGMGIVFRARDPKLNRVVAIKVLAPELAANPNARRRFLREAQAAAAISHPHVVTIHAVDEGVESSELRVQSARAAESLHTQLSTLPFIVMECIVGQTLQHKLDKQGSLRLMEILRIGHQTAEGLAAAHKQGLIHRDIKPANILLENGIERVKITDFGLARAADDVSITRTGEVSGTPQYMSPEQASGDAVDHRSDLFSLGSVLYAMCTGRSPFRATTLAAAIRRVCDDTPRPIEEINPEVPAWLIEIVNQLLAKNPDERIQTTEEVEHRLAEHLADIQQPFGRRPQADVSPSLRPRSGAFSTERSVAYARGTAEPGVSSMPKSVRVLLWVGTLTLLIPVCVLLAGFALRADNRALENAIVFGLFCVPMAVAMLAIALSDRYWRSNDVANGLFLLFCILLGPIGILLYLMRRDQPEERDEPPPIPAEQQGAPPAVAGPSVDAPAEIPQWLVSPLPGPVKVIALLLFVAASLVIGQGGEQWSDVSEQVGAWLIATGGLLAALAYQTASAAGLRFRGWHWVAIVTISAPLMFLGAQLPDREFKQGLAAESDTVAALAACLFLVILPLVLLFRALRESADHNGGLKRDRAGRILIGSGLFVWAALITWILLVAGDVISPPPFASRERIGGPIMLLFVFGGLLLVTGLILKRYVLTPSLVRQLSTATSSHEAESSRTLRERERSTLGTSPWRVLGWMIVGGLVLIPGCLIMSWMAYQGANQGNPSSDVGVVQIDFDSTRPITLISATGDFGAASSRRKVTHHPVTSNPFRLPLPPGVYDFRMTYQADGQTGTFTQRAELAPGRTTHVDVRQSIAIALQTKRFGDDPASGILNSPTANRAPGIRIVALGDVEIGRITIDEEDVTFKRDAKGDVHLPAAVGHRELTVFLQDGQKYHYGVDIRAGGVQSVQVPPGAEGLLRVNLVDPQLSVELRPLGETGSVFDDDPVLVQPPGSVTGSAVISESATYRVPAGRYVVWITDNLAGWVGEGTQSTTPYTFQEIEVAPGRSQAVTVNRSLNVQVDQFGGWSDRLYDFLWNQETYTLTRPQAHVVHRLFKAYAAGQPEAKESWLVFASGNDPGAENIAPSEGEIETSLATVFNEGEHPAWGTLIVPGEQAETYRLAELQPDNTRPPSPRAKINMTIEDGGLKVLLDRFVDESDDTEWTGEAIDESLSLSVQSGKYRVVVEDELAGWHKSGGLGDPGPVLYEYATIDCQPDKPVDLVVKRDFTKMAAGHPSFRRGDHDFRWQAEDYHLDGNQSVVVFRLLRAYAAGTPVVHEGALLDVANIKNGRVEDRTLSTRQADELLERLTDDGYSMKGVFTDGEHPAWEKMIVEGEKANTYRLAELNPMNPPQPPADAGGAAQSSHAPTVVGSLTPGKFERAGQLTIDIQDDGFLVALRRKSAFDGFVPGSEQQVTEFGQAYLRVHPGEYEVFIRDRFFGWGDRVESVTVAESDYPAITIKRDLAAYSREVPEQTADFLWDGERYEIGSRYGRYLVNRLLRAFAGASPDVEAETLLKELLAERDKGHKGLPERLDVKPYQDYPLEEILPDLFPGPLGAPSNVWGNLIVPGEAEGTYRLAPLNRGTLNVTGFEPGMSVQVTPVKQDSRFSSRRLWEEAQLQIPPGQYACSVNDANVQWGLWRKSGWSLGIGLPPARQETISVQTGEETAIGVGRQWSDYLNPPEPKQGDEEIGFIWFPSPSSAGPFSGFGVGGFFGQSDGIVSLNRNQFRIILALLKAYVAGQPEVAEADLLEQNGLGGKSWTEVFAEPGGSADDGWKTVIVSGETEGTWRLKPLQDSVTAE